MPFRTLLPIGATLLALAGCTSIYLQRDAGKSPDAFHNQALLGQPFELTEAFYVAEKRSVDGPESVKVPYVFVKGRPPRPENEIFGRVVSELPVGTRVEMVGEYVIVKKDVYKTDYNTGLFIVHSRPDLETLIVRTLLVSRGGSNAYLRGMQPVEAPSQWTQARSRAVAESEWAAKLESQSGYPVLALLMPPQSAR